MSLKFWKKASLIAASLALTLVCVAGASAQDKIRAVIIDGQNNHNWAETTPYLV